MDKWLQNFDKCCTTLCFIGAEPADDHHTISPYKRHFEQTSPTVVKHLYHQVSEHLHIWDKYAQPLTYPIEQKTYNRTDILHNVTLPYKSPSTAVFNPLIRHASETQRDLDSWNLSHHFYKISLTIMSTKRRIATVQQYYQRKFNNPKS